VLASSTKTLPEKLAIAMRHNIQLVNFVNIKALNARVRKKICGEFDSEHDTLLFHTEVRWLSKGNMLIQLYELILVIKIILNKNNSELLDKFSD